MTSSSFARPARRLSVGFLFAIVAAVPVTGAQPSTPPQDAETAAASDPAELERRLLQAARRGDSTALGAALDEGASPGAADAQGATALHHAAAATSLETVERLLAAGAGAAAAAADGSTPLHWASRSPGSESGRPVAAALLAAGAELEAIDDRGQTALHGAALDGDPALVELLLDRGAALDRGDDQGNTPLHQAVVGAIQIDRFAASYGSADRLASDGQQAVLELLISRGADVDARAADEVTALHRAARYGHQVITRILLEAGADPGARTSSGSTPRELALMERHQELAALLAGAEEDAADPQPEPGDPEGPAEG